MTPAANVVANWIPYKLFCDNGELFCHWLNLQDKKFEEPFFDETIWRLRALPANVKMFKTVSHLQMIPLWANGLATVKPTAIIFHLSRCGSTLVSQLLTLDDSNIVLPEVPFFDELLRLQYQQPAIETALGDKCLAAAVKFYGQQRNENLKNLFIKTDCWHIFFYKRLRQLFPDVPFVLLYRSPAEVLLSQQKRRGMQAVPGILEPELMGLTKEEIDHADFDGYFSRVMEKILAKFYEVQQNDPMTLLVNYKEGIIPIVQRIAGLSGINLPEELLRKMKDRSGYHAKYPGQIFTGEEKPEQFPEYLNKAMDWYLRLEMKREIIASAAAQ
jgi:hypothetical protein